MYQNCRRGASQHALALIMSTIKLGGSFSLGCLSLEWNASEGQYLLMAGSKLSFLLTV